MSGSVQRALNESYKWHMAIVLYWDPYLLTTILLNHAYNPNRRWNWGMIEYCTLQENIYDYLSMAYWQILYYVVYISKRVPWREVP